ncbi:MAG: FIST C-terminal domain-containing protein [Defluviitaleaceae bacterium]|nr:FIST C-terminal domain-containing protein [Defluviitaleaceae bacterium]
MTKTLILSTMEMDNPSAAVEEILSQIDLEKDLLTNSIGIISCHHEFATLGAIKDICNALPFDVVGIVASPLTDGTTADVFLLSILVITSDDVEFIIAETPSLLSDIEEGIIQSYKKANSHKNEKPTMVFAYAPFMIQNSGDTYVKALTDATNNAPIFGSLAMDFSEDFANCYTIFNDKHYADKMIVISAYGNLHPKFHVANISPEKISDQKALVTKSNGHAVIEVNNRPVRDYFESLGLLKASETFSAMSNIPFLVDYKDGTPMVSKIFVNLTSEGHALFAGAIPENSDIFVARTDKADVLATTGQLIDQILEDAPNALAILAYPCVVRTLALGSDYLGELEMVSQKVTDKIPLLMSYSGGEFCPTQITDEVAINRFHNNAFVVCVL